MNGPKASRALRGGTTPWSCTEDVRAPRGVAAQLRAGIDGSRLVVVPDWGHLCTVEAPAQVNQAIRVFLLALAGR